MITLTPEATDKVMTVLRGAITEERTDEWIELLLKRVHLPRWIPSFIVSRILDRLLPDVVLNSIEDLLRKAQR